MNLKIDQLTREIYCLREPDRLNILTEAQVRDNMFNASRFAEYDALKHTKLHIWLGTVTK
jgi:hypothetical protein